MKNILLFVVVVFLCVGSASAQPANGPFPVGGNSSQNLVPKGAVYTGPDSNPNFPGFYDYYLTVTPNVPYYVVITNTAAGNAAWDPNNFNILLTSGYITPTGNQILLQNGINTSVPVEERVYTSNVWNQFVVGTFNGAVQNSTITGSSFYNNTSHSLPLVYTNTLCKLSASNGNNWFYCTSGALTPDFVKGLSLFPSNTPTAQYFVTAVVSNKWVYIVGKVGQNYTNQYPIMNPVEWTHYDTTDSASDDAQGVIDSAGNPWATANDITSGYFLTDFSIPTTNGWTWTTDVHINGEHYMAYKSHFTGLTVLAISPSATYESLDIRADGGITTRGGAIIFMPVRTSGPAYCTNGASAYWNSNGIATYLRTSLAGQTTFTDHLQQAH